MKRKLKLSELHVNSFVTSEGKNEKTEAVLGGSTDTNPKICINYTNIGVCYNLTKDIICYPTYKIYCNTGFGCQNTDQICINTMMKPVC